MPELVEQMYCSQQIVIPPKFPYILKRYCKAAIKTQPYDLLRWSFEYFTALSENRPPPVKLRLEYPIYSTEGGLTKGCLKVLAHQLSGVPEVPLESVKAAWKGFCLDPQELDRIFCLCEVYLREDTVPFLHFIAVAGGLLTKTLTHTMILLCETLTKEPDGGSAAIPVQDFLKMYKFLAIMDASKDVMYFNGYREGVEPEIEASMEEEQSMQILEETVAEETSTEDFWQDGNNKKKIMITNDHVSQTTRLSLKLNMPILGKIERSPSMERAGQIERENYMRERKGRAAASDDVEQKLKELSSDKIASTEAKPAGEIKSKMLVDELEEDIPEVLGLEEQEEERAPTIAESRKICDYVKDCYEEREARREDLEYTFDEIAAIVEKFKSANYDLGMVAGRQMSTTSGEFIVHHIERDILEYIDEQIAILPDPDLKKKKAKPEEVAMIREILEQYLDENMDAIIPEIEEVEEEEAPLPEVTKVYAVPGIGPSVEEDMIRELEEYALEVSNVQAEVFMPRNIRHFLCPPLEKYSEHKYDEFKKEEVPISGMITD